MKAFISEKFASRYADTVAMRFGVSVDDGVPAEGKTFEDEELEKLKAKYDRMPMSITPLHTSTAFVFTASDAAEALRLHTFNKITTWYDPARMTMRVGYIDSRDRRSIQAMWNRNGYDRYMKLEFYMM